MNECAKIITGFSSAPVFGWRVTSLKSVIYNMAIRSRVKPAMTTVRPAMTRGKRAMMPLAMTK